MIIRVADTLRAEELPLKIYSIDPTWTYIDSLIHQTKGCRVVSADADKASPQCLKTIISPLKIN